MQADHDEDVDEQVAEEQAAKEQVVEEQVVDEQDANEQVAEMQVGKQASRGPNGSPKHVRFEGGNATKVSTSVRDIGPVKVQYLSEL